VKEKKVKKVLLAVAMAVAAAQASANGTLAAGVYINHEDHGGGGADSISITVNGQQTYFTPHPQDPAVGSATLSLPAGAYSVTVPDWSENDYDTDYVTCWQGNDVQNSTEGYVVIQDGQTSTCQIQYHYNPY
jgi:hypothetical protein